jgi:hypothetical protein
MRDELVFELSRDPEPTRKFTTFLGFAHAYFAHWRSTSQAALVETLLVSALNTKAIRERQSRVIASWAGAPFLFSNTADTRLADHLLVERGTLTQLRERFFLEPGCALLQKTTERAAEKEVQTLATKQPTFSPDQILIRLQWLREEVLRPDFDAEKFRDLLAKILLSDLSARSLPIQTMLMNWIYSINARERPWALKLRRVNSKPVLHRPVELAPFFGNYGPRWFCGFNPADAEQLL